MTYSTSCVSVDCRLCLILMTTLSLDKPGNVYVQNITLTHMHDTQLKMLHYHVGLIHLYNYIFSEHKISFKNAKFKYNTHYLQYLLFYFFPSFALHEWVSDELIPPSAPPSPSLLPDLARPLHWCSLFSVAGFS